MIKKKYYRPIMEVVKKPQTLLTAFSNVETEGLGEELNDNGGSDDMESAAW
jgi:hypothetical protein